MNFLAPAFLAGIAAIAIPVIIHLINRERKVVVEFPSLMFLQRIPYRSVRRQKIRHCCCCSSGVSRSRCSSRHLPGRSSSDGMRPSTGTGARELVDSARPIVEHGLRRSMDEGARRREEGRQRTLGDRSRDADRVRGRRVGRKRADGDARSDRGRDQRHEAELRGNALRAGAQARVADHLGVERCRAARWCSFPTSKRSAGRIATKSPFRRAPRSRPSTSAGRRRPTSRFRRSRRVATAPANAIT